MADRDTTGTGGANQNPTAKGASEAAGLKQNIGRATSEAMDQAMETGRQTVGSAQGRIRSLLEQQTDRAADQLGGVASALHKAAEQLDAENNGTAAQYAVQAAGRVERVADMLRHSSLDDLVGEVEGFARRQPEVFIGAAFAVGFLAARFIKSSSERRLQSQTPGVRSAAASRPQAYSQEGPSRGMAGGIADSAMRTPRRTVDMSQPPVGTPRPASTGTPLSRAPAAMGSHGAPPASPADTTQDNGAQDNGALGSGTLSGAGSTIKPQGQRP